MLRVMGIPKYEKTTGNHLFIKEVPMTTEDFITELFCRVDDALLRVTKHPQASLYPSEVVTLGLLFTIKGVGNRAFYRWIKRGWIGCFPQLPERT